MPAGICTGGFCLLSGSEHDRGTTNATKKGHCHEKGGALRPLSVLLSPPAGYLTGLVSAGALGALLACGLFTGVCGA